MEITLKFLKEREQQLISDVEFYKASSGPDSSQVKYAYGALVEIKHLISLAESD